MKRTIKSFAVLTAIALGFFTSCVEDVATTTAPEITVTAPTADTTAVMIGDSVVFNLSLSSETNLASLQSTSGIGIDFVNGSQTFTATLSETTTVTAKVNKDATVGSVIEVNFTVANDSKQASVKKHILVKAALTPLSAATAFEWKRVGGADATGLDMFGLTWTSNTTTNAVIKKGATKFVALAVADWTNIANLEALKVAIDAAADMDKWEAVSSQATKTYDLSLGTIKDNVYYLIHVTNGKVENVTAGTQITITGQYKK